MKQSVINGIGWAAKGYESHELQSFLGKAPAQRPSRTGQVGGAAEIHRR